MMDICILVVWGFLVFVPPVYLNLRPLKIHLTKKTRLSKPANSNDLFSLRWVNSAWFKDTSNLIRVVQILSNYVHSVLPPPLNHNFLNRLFLKWFSLIGLKGKNTVSLRCISSTRSDRWMKNTWCCLTTKKHSRSCGGVFLSFFFFFC